MSDLVAEDGNVEAVEVIEVVEDRDHCILHLRNLFALHGTAYVEDEDQVLRQRAEIFRREKVNKVAVLILKF